MSLRVKTIYCVVRQSHTTPEIVFIPSCFYTYEEADNACSAEYQKHIDLGYSKAVSFFVVISHLYGKA